MQQILNQSAAGSMWNRWDPHIHVPGTVLNDQYGTLDLAGWITKVEACSPSLQALGITDYCSLDSYEQVLAQKAAGKLAGIPFIFPNVEFRFSIGTSRDSPVNFHLLFSPEDADHVDQIKAFLRKLSFRDPADSYTCCREDLTRLGRAHAGATLDAKAAFKAGVNQFKVNFETFREEWDKSEWVQKNALFAVAAGETDGTSGVRDPEASNAALRRSIEAHANIIFSSQQKQVLFWLGKGAASLDELEKRWNGVKPCLHGCDAHAANKIGVVHDERYCWLKGDLNFETLRQACIEPALRVFIGAAPDTNVLPSQAIKKVRVTNVTCFSPDTIQINPGLTAIIGSRGSGKTALADLIAVGGGFDPNSLTEKSFVKRASDYLTRSDSILTWANNETTQASVSGNDFDDWRECAVQYLSQQFVDELCSSDGPSDRLMEELQRVVFESHPPEARAGCSTFMDLLAQETELSNDQRDKHKATLERVQDELDEQRQVRDGLATLRKRKEELGKTLAESLKDRTSLVVKGDATRVHRHTEISQALQKRNEDHAALQKQIRALEALSSDAADLLNRQAPEWLRNLQAKRSAAGLSAEEWKAFHLVFSGDHEKVIADKLKTSKSAAVAMLGKPVEMPDPGEADKAPPLVAEGADLSVQPINLLQAEAERLSNLIGIDAEKSKKFKDLNGKITSLNETISGVDKDIQYAEGAPERIVALTAERNAAYEGIFDSITSQERTLRELYEPLSKQLSEGAGSLAKLSFTVTRKVNVQAWSERGEGLLDLRKAGAFKGRGALMAAAEEALLPAWLAGSGKEVSAAMATFLSQHEQTLRSHRPDGMDNKAWVKSVGSWLRSTDHIDVSYDILYEGVEVERLSPGTRGIVLLTLYLAADRHDDRPLIIDQPEENLDPQSVNDELVTLFKAARARRQVIIVTHNANLVVNTDADQIIVASATPTTKGALPTLSYKSGGLENSEIRALVCRILEGGERAFLERAKRLRVKLRK